MNSVSNQVIASSKKIEKKPSNNPIIIDDQKIKRASLFGLGSNKEALIIGSTAKNSEQNSNNQSFANQETGFEMGNHSRRKNQKNINNTNNNNPILARPFTAPGNNEIKIGVLSNENINIEENEIIDHKKLGKPPLKSNKSLFLASEALPSPNHSQFQKELDADKLSIDLEKPLNQIRKETNNKNYNEVENYRKHCEEIRKNYEEQLKSLRLNSQQELEHEKNLKYQSIKELEEQNKREIFRLKEIHESEIKKKEEINKWEIDQIRRKFEMENEGLKRQIDEQIKLASLAEEIKKHSDKLSNISDKLSVNENGQNANKNAELYAKEQFLKELERKYNKEKELIVIF